MSGAGISMSGPMTVLIEEVYLRVSLSSSEFESSLGLQMTPPFAPPNGMSTIAHFQVIHMARARTSSISVSGL